MKKKKICVVITARPSYSRIKTALVEILKSESLELQLVVTGSALIDRYGSVVHVIENDGFKIDSKVFNILEGDNKGTPAKTTGIGLIELATVFTNLEPDLVVTIADRFETIATAIAASFMNIPLVHIQGGEVTGNIDEKVRHSITKLADLHLVASDDARNRVIKMGEIPDNVITTGCPSIDLAHEVLMDNTLNFDPFEKYGGVGKKFDISKGYLVVMQHPDTTEQEQSRYQIEQTLQAVTDLNVPTFWFWPNVDAGSDGTSKGIRVFREHNKEKTELIYFFKNMESVDFLKLIANAWCLIGNSSVGIRESSFLGVPVVNIGKRQNKRVRGNNVVDVDYDHKQIMEAIQYQIKNGKYLSEPIYGDGFAGIKIVKELEKWNPTYKKVINY